MRNVLGPVRVAGLLLIFATSARAQVAPGGGAVVLEAPGMAPVLPPSIYASDMLPVSLSHPWVMVPRHSTAATAAAAIGYGNRFSPYGIYSRYAFYRTGPYPGVLRPNARFEFDHWHNKHRYMP